MSDPQKTSRSIAPFLVVGALLAAGGAAFLLLNGEPRVPEQASPPSAAPAVVASAAPAAPTSALQRRAPVPLKLAPPPAVLRKTPEGPLDASRGGVATVVGRMIRLDAGREVLGDAKQICLTDEAGTTDTCAVLDGWPTKRAICSRAHPDAPLKGAIKWQVPCP